MDLNPSVYDIVMTAVMSIMAITFLRLAYRVGTGRKRHWLGRYLYRGGKRTALTRYLLTLGVLSAIGAVGDLLYSNTINGLVYLFGAGVLVAMVRTLHKQPQAIGFVARTADGRRTEKFVVTLCALVFLASAVLNLGFGIHT